MNEYAREHGVSVTLGSISAMNAQSLSLAKHYNRPTAMKVTLIHVRPFQLAHLPRFRRPIQFPLQLPDVAFLPEPSSCNHPLLYATVMFGV